MAIVEADITLAKSVILENTPIQLPMDFGFYKNKALDVTKCEPPKIPYGQIGNVVSSGKNTYCA